MEDAVSHFPAWCVCEGKAKVLLCVLWACVLWDFPDAVPLGSLGCQHIHVSQPGSQKSRAMSWDHETAGSPGDGCSSEVMDHALEGALAILGRMLACLPLLPGHCMGVPPMPRRRLACPEPGVSLALSWGGAVPCPCPQLWWPCPQGLCLCPQVSHHPPAAAHHVYSRRGWTLWQEITIASKFRGKYLSIMPLGR